MAAAVGNQYARKGKLFERSLLSAIREDDGAALFRAAKRLLRLASAGNLQAIALLADRLDGRVMQMPDISGDGQLVVSWVMRPDSTSPVTIDGQAAESVSASIPDASCQVASTQQATEYALTNTAPEVDSQADGSVARKSEGGVDGDGTPPPTFPNSDWP